MSDTYNGWTNYETWNVKLWMDNDQGSYDYWRERAVECLGEDPRHDCATRRGASDVRRFADELSEYHAEANPLGDTASTLSDLRGAALSSVNWREIAESLLSDMSDESEADKDAKAVKS